MIANLEKFRYYDFVHDGVFILDKNFNVLFWNKTLSEYSQIKSESIINENLLDQFPNLNKPGYIKRFEHIFAGGPPEIFSSQLHKYLIPCPLPGNKFRIQHSTIIAMKTESGDANYAVCSIKDLTDEHMQLERYKEMRNKALHEVEERKKAEELLNETVKELQNNKQLLVKKSVELKKSNAAKDKFLSIIGHDLKNPLQALIGYSNMLSDDFHEFSDADKIEYINTINHIANQIKELLNNLLNWARLQSNLIEVSLEINKIATLISKVVSLLEPNAAAKNIEVSIDTNISHSGFFDANMIETVLRNILSNSIKYTPRDGRIEILTYQTNKELLIVITDSGLGIAEDKIKDIFKIDQKKSTRGTENEEGTGLGLLLCKEFIEKNKGTIQIESIINTGTTVTITLPRTPKID